IAFVHDLESLVFADCYGRWRRDAFGLNRLADEFVEHYHARVNFVFRHGYFPFARSSAISASNRFAFAFSDVLGGRPPFCTPTKQTCSSFFARSKDLSSTAIFSS